MYIQKCTANGDFEGTPTVHMNFPLLSFSLYITFKLGLPLQVRLFPRNRGGLVNEYLSFLARLRFFLFLFLFYFILFISIFFYNHRMCKVAQGVIVVLHSRDKYEHLTKL